MNTIDSTQALYECANKCTIQRHTVPYPELADFALGLSEFQSHLGERMDDAYWQKYMADLRRMRFGLCAAPFLLEYRDQRIAEINADLSYHLRFCSEVYPDVAPLAHEVLRRLVALQGDGKNPLLDMLLELSLPSQATAWVIKESRLIPHVDEVLKVYEGLAANIRAVHYTQLASHECYDRIIVLGAARWFPSSVFTSPRSSDLNVLQYNWMHDSWTSPVTFIKQYKASKRREVSINDDPSSEAIKIAAESIMLSLEAHQLASSAAYESRPKHEYDEVDAKCVVLEGENAIFLAADHSSGILVIDIDEREDERVQSIDVDDLTPGNFVLVRTRGGGDYIVPIADEIMGSRAEFARQCQAEWKALLREYVVEHGLFETSIRLLDFGSEIANEVNVRNWMYPRNIRTRQRSDFAAIMRLVGLEDRTDEIWSTMRLIAQAHRSAGHRLKRMLLEEVDQVSPDEFRRNGKIEFRLVEDTAEPDLIAFRVEAVLSDYFRVAFSQIGQLIRLGT